MLKTDPPTTIWWRISLIFLPPLDRFYLDFVFGLQMNKARRRESETRVFFYSWFWQKDVQNTDQIACLQQLLIDVEKGSNSGIFWTRLHSLLIDSLINTYTYTCTNTYTYTCTYMTIVIRSRLVMILFLPFLLGLI